MRRVVDRALRAAGYRLAPYRAPSTLHDLRPGFRSDYNAEAYPLIERVRAQTMLSYPNLVALYEQVRHVEAAGVPGAFVECGVWKGGAAGLLAAANLARGARRRHLHLFDSFDDMPEPDPARDGGAALREFYDRSGRDPSRPFTGALTAVPGVYDAIGGPGSAAECERLIVGELGYPAPYLHVHAGWFQDTVAPAAPSIGEIALLRLDGDLYASTRTCLEALYGQVARGGIVVVDDYGAYAGCRRAVDEFLAERGERPFLAYSDPHCRYWQKC